MTDFERACALMFKLFGIEGGKWEKESPFPGSDELRALDGSIDIWDADGCNSLCLNFNPDGSFKDIFLND